MADLPPTTMRWLAAHHGVISSRTLREHNVGPSTVVRLVHRGVLRHPAKGVYVLGAIANSVQQRCAIVCAAHPTGFITGPTAGTLAGLRRMPRQSSVHFAVLHGRHLGEEPGVRFRQTTVIWAVDRIAHDDGIVVASWPRLAFELAADLQPIDHLSIVQQLLHERRATSDELAAIDRRLGHPARPGSGRFRRTLESLDGCAPNESHPEVVLADALRRRGVPVEAQVTVVRPSTGRAARIDLAVTDVRWGIEIDIHPEHRTFDGQAADSLRRRDLHRMHWQIEPVTEVDMGDVERLADDLVHLYLARRREFLAVHPSAS